MSDPFSIFKGASPSKQQMLATVWKELYASLAGLDKPKAARTIGCVTCRPPAGLGPQPIAVGRPYRLGPPVCRKCLERMAERPGGWPLEASRQDDPVPGFEPPKPLPRPRAFWEK